MSGALNLIIARGFDSPIQGALNSYNNQRQAQEGIESANIAQQGAMQNQQWQGEDRALEEQARQKAAQRAQEQEALLAMIPEIDARLRANPDDQEARAAAVEIHSRLNPEKASEGISGLLYPKQSGPQSALGKLGADLAAGRISQADYDAAARKATYIAPPSATNVTVAMPPQEREEDKAVGKAFGNQYADIQKAGVEALRTGDRFSRLGQLLEGVQTGKLTPLGTELAAYAQSAGFNIDPKLGNKQGAEALSNEIALSLRNPAGGAGMPGALSDKDREFLLKMVPGLATTPEGRDLMIQTAKKLAKRSQEVAKLARDYRSKNGSFNDGFFDELSAWSNSNPLFNEPIQPKKFKTAGGATVEILD